MDKDDWDVDVSDNTDSTQPNDEPTEILMSKKKVGTILIFLICMVIIILYMVKGCNIVKVNDGSTESTNVVNLENQTIEEYTEITEITELNNSENLSVSEEVSSISEELLTTEFTEILTDISEDVISTEISEIPTEETFTEISSEETLTEEQITDILENTNPSIIEISELNLNEPINTSGIVSGKSIYKLDNSYLYAVSVIAIISENQNVVCKYYCPKKSWDLISVGNSVDIIIQYDITGAISVLTMSLTD